MEQKLFLNTDDETRKLPTEQALTDYFDFRKANDITVNVYNTECHTVGVGDTPLLNNEIRAKENLTEEQLDDNKIHTAAGDNQILLVFPINNRYEVFPVRYTAFPDLLSVAGVSGRLMLLTEKRGPYSPLAPETKGHWITTGLHLNDSMSHVLVRDGKAEHFKGPRYQVLPEWEGLYALKDHMRADYPDHSYVEGAVSHEVLSVWYDTGDEVACNQLKLILRDVGIKEDVRFLLRYTTSEVGNAAMKVSPIFMIGTKYIPIGTPIYVRHDAGNEVSHLTDQFYKIGSMVKEAEDRVEELGNRPVKHRAGCFQHVARSLKVFSEGQIEAMVEKILNGQKDPSGLAIEVYLDLVSLVEENPKLKDNITAYIHASETVARAVCFRFSDYDRPLEYREGGGM